MDNAFDLFHERIIEAIRGGDVVCLFFPRLGKTLILDLRWNDDTPPAVFLEDMVSGPRERLASLERLRPQFALPDELRLAPWFGFVRSMRESGVYDVILERCAQTGHTVLADDCRDKVSELERLEKRFIRAVVSGSMSRAIWQRPAS
ncbi:MAG TPA: hypothetical protein VML96_01940 [Egibacteraceae bacterium]|nr:hypothetical protein [Egibacteraceae bacterium]